MKSCACRKSRSVPETPEFVEGVINLRGKIISVVDLRKRFGGAEIKPHKKNRVIVVEIRRQAGWTDR